MAKQEQSLHVVPSCEDTKMLGAHVPESVYWAFKKAAAGRKESLQDAIKHAALMYINVQIETGEVANDK